uniref:A disintegrin and metalloproteinase with thrombospondin motifs 7-like n=1 Tax=Cyprinodon variegatus TaxID=28743 RepID=A0A3Q2G4F6_CYPVA
FSLLTAGALLHRDFFFPVITFTLIRAFESLIYLHDLPPYEVVHPTRVDARGHFLSNVLSYRTRRVQRRETSEDSAGAHQVFYQFLHGGHSLHFNLTLNPNLLAPGFMTERRYGGLEGAKIQRPGAPGCYYLGEVWDRTTVKGHAAISTCDGLVKIENHGAPISQTHECLFFRCTCGLISSCTQPPFSSRVNLTFEGTERQRERWERRNQGQRRRIHRRSESREKWVETLVVVDPKMVDYHGSKDVESYALAVMNIVAGIFRDASIGNAINIVIVRLILLEQDEDDLKITHHADNSLSSFCKWQKKLNMKGDEHPLHHDVAVLLTRKDICAAFNMPCETLGLSHVAGMCQPHRSCSISEDTGLPMAFTVAHELGHNFGIQHDGNGNDCEPIGKRPFVMSPQLLYGTFLPRWSRCSRQYITRFLDRGWGWCLDDAPMKARLSLTSVLPGVLYTAVHQCRLQYGSGSRLCDDVDNVCSTLWCTVGTTCHSKLDGAVDGTSCGEDKWCINGECVPSGHKPESVHGGWASWSEWSACTRTCGAGIQSAERECDNPVPKHRGKYCLGVRRKYKICNTRPCQPDKPSFRDIQCTHFNTLPYKGKFYKWHAVINKVAIFCSHFLSHLKMRDVVVDGTPCYEDNKSRDMCINGICQNIGCDYVINSNSVEDRCGVCNGNGSTCTTVRRTFKKSEGIGYVDVGLIPEGAWDILIEEVAEAGNFLALRSDNPSRYFLNGGWTIQWNGEYKAAGAVFTYERTGQLENLTSPGPTMEPLWIQLLFQETNPGVRYEYTVSQNSSKDDNSFGYTYFWKYGSWTECSVTCGRGVQGQIVYCVEKTTGIAEEHFCDPSTRPDDNQTSCYRDPCPAIWWVGEWHKCSASCGSLGQAIRTVLCIQAVSAEEQKALDPSDCNHIPRPESVSVCNIHIPCPADWSTGSWSKCSVTCGPGTRHRNVTCSRNTGVDCDPQNKPSAVTSCQVRDCPSVLDNFGGIEWSGSGWMSNEVFNEINILPEAKPLPKYGTNRGQPRSQKDHNYVVEGDFHYNNNIENNQNTIEDNEPSRETSVHIDDFYYDYNFIDFHEDLFNELGIFEEESDDSHSLNSPQEAKPTQFIKEKESTETNVKKVHSEQEYQDEINDFLYEDHLLPVSATRPSPLSTTPDSQTVQKGKSLMPEVISTKQSLVVITKWPVEDETRDMSDSIFSTETDVRLDKILQGATSTPPDGKQIPSYAEKTGTDGAFQPTSFHSSDFHYNEILIPSVVQSSDNSHSGAKHQSITTSIIPKLSSAPAQQVKSTTPSALILPTSAPLLHSVQTSASTLVNSAAFWITGNWSSCSTSCGLGAIWRTLICSTGSESDCDQTKRPAPARQCYLRPCSSWKVGEWSKCSKNCEGGIKLREVQCFDLRDQRPLRPFHCRAMSSRPLAQMPCNVRTCLDWYTSSWGQCSEVCGGGEQQRIVTCPEDDRCDRDLQPSAIQSCNIQPCAQWLTGSWGQCSASCGGGLQHRLIKCVNTKAEDSEELDQDQCDNKLKPNDNQKCNMQDCKTAPSEAVCLRDWLTSRFCQTLRSLGRCRLPNMQIQCCKTCSQRGSISRVFRH